MKKRFTSNVRYFSTIILHVVLLTNACATVNHYPDLILWGGFFMLTVHLIFSFKVVKEGTPPQPIGICHTVGTVVQILVMNRLSDQVGLGGGFAIFFYKIMLSIFQVLMLVCLPIAYYTRKKTH